MIDYKDYTILCDVEYLLYELLDKYVEKTYNEEGESDSKEWQLWNKYWNVVERVSNYLDKLYQSKIEMEREEI